MQIVTDKEDDVNGAGKNLIVELCVLYIVNSEDVLGETGSHDMQIQFKKGGIIDNLVKNGYHTPNPRSVDFSS